MKYLPFVIALTAVTLACQSPKKEEAPEETAAKPPAPPVTLTQKWKTDTLLTTCESVIYDKDGDILYVANINGAPDGKDGNGFISKVTLDGTIAEQQWVKGLDAPKGMGINSGKLYVSDIDKIREIEIASGRIVKTYPVEGAKFLNDITVDASGKVYVSDTGTGDIVVLENGKVSKWVSGIDGPNGLLAEGDKFLVVTFNGQKLHTIDPTSKQIESKTDSIDSADGIEALGDTAYLVSSWNGIVSYVGPDWKKTVLIDTRGEKINAADIEFIPEKNLVLVPNFFKNTVTAYEISK